MPDTDRSPADLDDLDETLRRLARGLVSGGPEVPDFARVAPSVSMVRPGQRPRRAPILVAAAAIAAVALAAGVAVVRGAGTDDRREVPPSTPADGPGPGPEPGPQHLVVDGLREVLPDGEVVDLEQGDSGSVGSVRFRPGGGYVVLGTTDTSEVGEGSGDAYADVHSLLVVVGPDGAVEVEREVPQSSLVAVSDTEAVLSRRLGPNGELDPAATQSLVTHDLATGDERPIAVPFPLGPPRWQPEMATIVSGELLAIEAPVEQSSDGPCFLRTIDLATGKDSQMPLDLDCAYGTLGLHVSPDGKRAAFAYGPSLDLINNLDGPPRLAVIHVYSGSVDLTEELDLGGPVEGLAWKDDTTLTVATSPPGSTTDSVTVHELAVP
jgi:hypothetical protein